MLRQTAVARKAHVILKQGQGLFSHQLKRILQKNHVHYYRWDPLHMYPARRLAHADVTLDAHTGARKWCPHRAESTVLVPDQKMKAIPVPRDYTDAYWWRDRQSRRVQCPVRWVEHRMYSGKQRKKHDFQDLAFARKFQFGVDDCIEHARRQRR
jgi:hypothetical protein